FPARGASEGTVVEGLCESALRADRLDEERRVDQTRRPISFSGGEESVRNAACQLEYCRVCAARLSAKRTAGHSRSCYGAPSARLGVSRFVLCGHHLN